MTMIQSVNIKEVHNLICTHTYTLTQVIITHTGTQSHTYMFQVMKLSGSGSLFYLSLPQLFPVCRILNFPATILPAFQPIPPNWSSRAQVQVEFFCFLFYRNAARSACRDALSSAYKYEVGTLRNL